MILPQLGLHPDISPSDSAPGLYEFCNTGIDGSDIESSVSEL